MGIMKYSVQDSCTAKNGDLEDSQGKTQCYATDPTRTHIGELFHGSQAQKVGLLPPCFGLTRELIRGHETSKRLAAWYPWPRPFRGLTYSGPWICMLLRMAVYSCFNVLQSRPGEARVLVTS